MYRTARVSAVLAVAVACALFARPAGAVQIIFTIDPALSTFFTAGADESLGPFGEQTPGSMSTPVRGHFLVSFDPATSEPATLELIGGHGYFAADSDVSAQAGGGIVQYSIRDVVWAFASGPINRSGGVYPATGTTLLVHSAGLDVAWFDGSSRSYDYSGRADPLTSGDWTLTESAPGSWTLSIEGYQGIEYSGLTEGFIAGAGSIVSTAQFGAANMAAVAPGGSTADGLGGSEFTGGVSATFSQPVAGGGTLTVQQVPDKTGLPLASIAAAEANPFFALSTEALVNPQIWNVDFDGDLGGGTVDLTFAYDESLLPDGLDESTLGIWHFSSQTGEWQFGGTVDPNANTITYTTDHFSEFQIGVVPEPSTFALAGAALVALLAGHKRRVRRRHDI